MPAFDHRRAAVANSPVTALPPRPTASRTAGLPAPAAAAPALTPVQLQELAEARTRAARLRRAASYATFDAWCIAILGGLTLVFSLLNVTALLMGGAMCVIAFIEFRGVKKLSALDPAAPRLLGFNQLAFAGLLIAYALWSIYATVTGPDPYAAYVGQAPELDDMLGPIRELTTQVTLAAYIGLIIVATVVQGGTAWYHFSRARHLRAYVQQTPQWIMQLQRAGVTV